MFKWILIIIVTALIGKFSVDQSRRADIIQECGYVGYEVSSAGDTTKYYLK